MKTTVVAFESRTDNFRLEKESRVISLLNASAVYVDTLIMLSEGDEDGFKNALSTAGEVVVIVNADKATFSVKKALEDNKITVDEDGFFIGEKFVALIGDKTDEATILEKLSKFFGFSVGKATFKLFGVNEEKIKLTTDSISEKYPTVFFNVSSNALDGKVDLFYSDKSPKMQVDGAIKQFINTFENSIYADEDVGLNQRLKDLLKLHRLTLSTAESMTGGAIAAEIVKVDGASDVFYEGMVTYNTLAKERRLGVLHKTVVEKTVVSSEVAYEMAAGLLNNADVAITITGYAGSDVHPDENDGLCFIGIGLKEKIEVYRFKFGYSRKENIRSAVHAALFLAIKTVQNTDF